MEKPSILIVAGDISATTDSLSAILGDEAHIVVANNAAKALKILNKNQINLVICDIEEPGSRLTNLQLCAHIKASLATCHLPVVLVNAEKIAGFKIGADACIEPPFLPAYLKAQIFSLLQNRLRIKAHFSYQLQNSTENIRSTPTNRGFSGRLQALIEEHLADPMLDIAFLAARLHMSRGSLYRKMKEISNISPAEIIEITRVKKAALLIRERLYKMNEIAVLTGYSSAAQFSKSFKRQFGLSPLQYGRQNSGCLPSNTKEMLENQS